MPTLEEMLRASLKSANEKFDKANNDLHALTAETAKAIEAVAEGKATLRLAEAERTVYWTRYDLVLTSRSGNESRKLALMGVTKSGYPIQRLEGTERRNTFTIAEEFDSLKELSAFFQKLASDSDSTLVAHLAFDANRRHAPAQGDEKPAPFDDDPGEDRETENRKHRTALRGNGYAQRREEQRDQQQPPAAGSDHRSRLAEADAAANGAGRCVRKKGLGRTLLALGVPLNPLPPLRRDKRYRLGARNAGERN